MTLISPSLERGNLTVCKPRCDDPWQAGPDKLLKMAAVWAGRQSCIAQVCDPSTWGEGVESGGSVQEV